MTPSTFKPMFMGASMGLMMLWMLHMQFTEDSPRSLATLAIFVGVHIVILAGALSLPFIASPRLRRALNRLHRPSLRHVALMLAGAALSAGVAHLIVHSGVS